MEFLGIGPLELFFIILIALIVLGPKDMVKAGRTIGRFLRSLVTSPTWRTIQQTSRDLRYLPNRLMREAGLEDLKSNLPEGQSIRKDIGLDQLENDMKQWQNDVGTWNTPPAPVVDSPPPPELTSKAEENPASEAEQAPEVEAQVETPPTTEVETQVETPPAPDLSAWTTPPAENDNPHNGKASSTSPATDPDDSTSRTNP